MTTMTSYHESVDEVVELLTSTAIDFAQQYYQDWLEADSKRSDTDSYYPFSRWNHDTVWDMIGPSDMSTCIFYDNASEDEQEELEHRLCVWIGKASEIDMSEFWEITACDQSTPTPSTYFFGSYAAAYNSVDDPDDFDIEQMSIGDAISFYEDF